MKRAEECKNSILFGSEAHYRYEGDPELKEILLSSEKAITEKNLRHWLVSMSDYARREPKILINALDDEMVCVDIEKFLKAHFQWFKNKAEETVTNIASESAIKLYTYLNVEVLRNQETIDNNFLGFTNPIKCIVMGGTSTFHEFLQPLMHVVTKYPKFRTGNFLRIYIVPTQPFSLANLISKNDHWY